MMPYTSAAAAGPPPKTVSSSSDMTVASRRAQRASARPYSCQIRPNSELERAAVGPSATARYEPSMTKCVKASSANQSTQSESAYESDAERDAVAGRRRGGMARRR